MTEQNENGNNENGNVGEFDRKLEEIIHRHKSTLTPDDKAVAVQTESLMMKRMQRFDSTEIKSHAFDAGNLQRVVDEIKVIEDGIKGIIAARTKKVVEEKIPIQKQRPVSYPPLQKALISLGLKKQEMESYTDFEVITKEVPRTPDDVDISEFRVMIDKYIRSLTSLNDGLRGTVTEVDLIVKNLTQVSDTFTDQIHSDRRAYQKQIQLSNELEGQLKEIVAAHDNMSPLHDKFAEIEKIRDHMEMALRESQGMELKYKNNIDMGIRYQAALKSYRKLINDFKERGDIHVNMVDKFADGASHMKIAVDNVSQICSGVARVTQSMIMIVESIEDGNRVLGRYASLIGDQMTTSPQWQMEYSALKDAEEVYMKNDEIRLSQIQENRKEIEKIINPAVPSLPQPQAQPTAAPAEDQTGEKKDGEGVAAS